MAHSGGAAKLQGCRILVIEDERIIREIVVRMLKSLGVGHVVEVATAEEGWSCLVGARREGFHLVLTDLTLPGASGATLIKALRELPSPGAKTLPIIVITGSTDVDTYRKIAASGVSGYLIKPISRDLLRGAIENALFGAARVAEAAV